MTLSSIGMGVIPSSLAELLFRQNLELLGISIEERVFLFLGKVEAILAVYVEVRCRSSGEV
jgi:hypothetical protein